MKKPVKVGICHRTVNDDDTPGELYLTAGALRSAIRSALRKLWTTSTRRIFLEQVRFQHDFGSRVKYAVKCNDCGEIMAISAKDYVTKKDGSLSKKKKVIYDVDHLTGSPGFNDIEEDLGEWADNLFNGYLQVLCRECHKTKTLSK